MMSSAEIDDYLDSLDGLKRATLRALRETIREVVPQAEQGLSYRLPAFRLRGTVIAGFAGFKNHLSYLPHSGSVFPALHDDLRGFSYSKGALRFAIDEPLSKELVQRLIDVRISQAFPRSPS